MKYPGISYGQSGSGLAKSFTLFNLEGAIGRLCTFKCGKERKFRKPCFNKHGGVAQLGEHLPCKQGVRSSILLISTNPADKPGHCSLKTV